MSILLLLNPIFHMWETVHVGWKNYNILDRSGDVPTHPLVPIEKLEFGCLSNMKGKRLEKLA
jgi:hypothetical protein